MNYHLVHVYSKITKLDYPLNLVLLISLSARYYILRDKCRMMLPDGLAGKLKSPELLTADVRNNH